MLDFLRRVCLPAAASVVLLQGSAMAAIQQGDITIDLAPVATGLHAPVGGTNAGDSRLFVIDQVGEIRIIKDGALLSTPFLDVSDKVIASGERGLLGLAFHPDYQTNGKFYIYYSAPGAPAGFGHRSIISEWQVSDDPDLADPDSERIVLTFNQPQGNHNAGDIHFGPDGYLYIASGDGGGANDAGTGHTPDIGNALDPTKLLGKILRVDVDGQDEGLEYAIPADNPFVGDPEARQEIYALGLRNPFRFSFDRGGEHQLFAGDVGQREIEEVDIIVKGGNYGWKAKEGTRVFDASLPQTGYIDPIAEYDHSEGIAIIGGYVYRGNAFPELYGKYVFGDVNGRLFYLDPQASPLIQIYSFQLTANAQSEKQDYLKGLGQDVNGELYFMMSDRYDENTSNARVLQIRPPQPSVGAARVLGPGQAVSFSAKPVTRVIDGYTGRRYYIEEPDRSSGIAVLLDRAYAPGTLVDVEGELALDAGELVIANASDSEVEGEQVIRPLGVTNAAAVNKLAEGLLVTVWGRVVGTKAGQRAFRIDDGSGLVDDYGNPGLRVYHDGSITQPALGEYVRVTGTAGKVAAALGNLPVIYVAGPDDYEVISTPDAQ